MGKSLLLRVAPSSHVSYGRCLDGRCLGARCAPVAVSATRRNSALVTQRPPSRSRLMFLNDLRDSLEGPVDLLPGDDERRRDANDPVVRLLGQDSFFFE